MDWTTSKVRVENSRGNTHGNSHGIVVEIALETDIAMESRRGIAVEIPVERALEKA